MLKSFSRHWSGEEALTGKTATSNCQDDQRGVFAVTWTMKTAATVMDYSERVEPEGEAEIKH